MRDIFGTVFFTCIFLIVGIFMGIPIGASVIRTQAIEAGAAFYTVNEKTGESTFKFKTYEHFKELKGSN